jgi:hypothetical protein
MEQKLAKMLGLESVDELEVALDSLNGIAPDGGELEGGGEIAREARIREAYLNWCKEFGKRPDESRFPDFSNNFLLMEQYSKETAKEMTLNQYADFTKEEYEALVTGSSAKTSTKIPASATTPAEKGMSAKEIAEQGARMKKSLEAALEAAAKAALEAKEKAAKQIEVARREIDGSADETPEEREERLKRQAELDEKDRQMKAEARARKAKEIEEKAKLEAEKRAQIEKEQAARQKELENELEKQKAQAETEAIAAAKAQAEREAALASQRAYYEVQAAEIARKKAREFEEQQRKNAQAKVFSKTKKTEKRGFFSAPAKKPEPVQSPKVEIELNLPSIASIAKTKKEKKSQKANAFSSFFSLPTPAPAKKPAPKVAPKTRPATVAKKSAPSKKDENPFAALFAGSPSTASMQSTPAPAKPVTAAKKKEENPIAGFFAPKSQPLAGTKIVPPKVVSSTVTKPTPVPAPKKPATPAFSFFSIPSADKKVTPTMTPTTASPSKKSPSSQFSFFPAPSPAKKAPVVAQAPSKKSSTPAFSFFSAPAPAKKVEPAPAASPKSRTLSLFGSSAPAPNKVAEMKVPKQQGTMSLFGGQNQAPAKRDVPVPNRPGTISLFGSGGPPPKPKTTSKSAASVKASPSFSLFGSSIQKPAQVRTPTSAPSPKSPTFSLFGSPKPKDVEEKVQSKSVGAPPAVPILSQWTQNADGSITGRVSNSKDFRSGTEITTSPVRKGAKPGSVITTGSGSKYYLK